MVVVVKWPLFTFAGWQEDLIETGEEGPALRQSGQSPVTAEVRVAEGVDRLTHRLSEVDQHPVVGGIAGPFSGCR